MATNDHAAGLNVLLTMNGQCNTNGDHACELFSEQTPQLPKATAVQNETPRSTDQADFIINHDVGARLIGIYLDSIHPIWPILYVDLLVGSK